MINFNKPYFSGNELKYIQQAFENQKLSGNGDFTNKVHEFFNGKYNFKKCLLTSSCTDALEMSALLSNIGPGDEVIMPTYTFVSTANAFVLRGATIVFVDSRPDHPGMDEAAVEALITKRTKAIVVVHYAGVACDMDLIMAAAQKHNLIVIEDAAQSIDSFYKNRPLGGIGHLAAFSFHETKNIMCGEGGMLVVNDVRFTERSEIIWEKGTNRASFFRGEIDKYGWCDIGSSFLLSEIAAAFLFSQVENLDDIQAKRKLLWRSYQECFKDSRLAPLPIPAYATNNAHIYYLMFDSLEERTKAISILKDNKIHAVFHYTPLHKSPFYGPRHDGRILKHAERYSDNLLRLPMHYNLTIEDTRKVAEIIKANFPNTST